MRKTKEYIYSPKGMKSISCKSSSNWSMYEIFCQCSLPTKWYL